MYSKYIGSFAEIVSQTGWEQVTNKKPTSYELLEDIRVIFNDEKLSEVAYEYYSGFVEIIKQVDMHQLDPNELLKYLLSYLNNEIVKNIRDTEKQVSAYVLGTVSATKAVLDHIRTENRKSYSYSETTVSSIIESIDWEMSKHDLDNVFGYMDKLPPHPNQNAIGYSSNIYNIPGAVICYFKKKLLKEQLGAINIVIYEEPPSLEELDQMYQQVVLELKTSYGNPRLSTDEYSVWILRGHVIHAGTLTGVLGIRYGDPKIDKPSAIAIGRG